MLGRLCAVGRVACERVDRARYARSSLAVLRRAEGGVATLEFALAATVLLGLLVPVVDLGQAFSQRVRVEQAVQAGALYASIHPWNSNSPSQIVNAVNSAANLPGLTVAAPTQTCGCPTGTSVTVATCQTTCSNGKTAGYYVSIAAQLPYTPTVPYTVLGNSVTLQAQAFVRIQ